MADVLTKEQRHRNMAAIHGKNTKPEILVRKFLLVGASAIGSTIHVCPVTQIWCCVNTARSSL